MALPQPVIAPRPGNAWDYLGPQVAFVVRLLKGEIEAEDILWILGDPDSNFALGSVQYARYSKYGLEVILSLEQGKVVKICPIPPKIPNTLAAKVQEDMKDLQGVWELTATESQGKKQIAPHECPTYLAFDGNRLTFYGGGIAPAVCYSLDPSTQPKRIRFFLPDPDDDKALWLPRQAIYAIDGDQFIIRGEDSANCYQRVNPNRKQ
jgi:uncharacterized protein (TIGR03067 family)